MLPFLVSLGFVSILVAYRRWEGVAFLSLPLLITAYFAISTRIFSFGTDLPFGLYSARLGETYALVQAYILLHFLAAYTGRSTVGLLPRRSPCDAFGGATSGEAAVPPIPVSSFRPERSLGLIAFAFCISPAVFVILAVGFGELVERGHFVPEFGRRGLMRLADVSFWLSALATPFLKRWWMRLVVLAAIVFVFAALGSRSAPVMLIVYVLVERFILQQKNSVSQGVLALIAVSLLSLLLSVRSSGQGGLVSLAARASTMSLAELLTLIVFGLNYMLNFSIAINAEMLTANSTEATSFIYSILPLPSAVYDMTAGYDQLNRFRANIPFPGFGYAVDFLGPWIYFLGVFLVFLAVEVFRAIVVIRRDLGDRILYYGWVFLPLLVSLQYNLRTSFRLFYIFLGMYVLYASLRRVRFRRAA